MSAPPFPEKVARALQAAIALDLGPERVIENAARAAVFEAASLSASFYAILTPEDWLCRIRRHVPPKPNLTLVPPLPADEAGTPVARRRRHRPRLRLIQGGGLRSKLLEHWGRS
ncbi:MAG: hypothetical protein QM756_10505 [Polyangiaceae bacterium]